MDKPKNKIVLTKLELDSIIEMLGSSDLKDLELGWNLFTQNLSPNDSEDLRYVVKGLKDRFPKWRISFTLPISRYVGTVYQYVNGKMYSLRDYAREEEVMKNEYK